MACSTCNADGACGCVSNYKEKDFGTRPMWTLGGANNNGLQTYLLAGSDIEDAAPTLAALQATITVAQASLNFKCSVLFQVSADGINWDTAVIFTAATYQTGNGTLCYAWNMATTNYKRKIRFLVNVEQSAGTSVEMADVKVVVGFQVK